MLEREKREKILEESEEVEREYDTMYYPQVDGITPTVVAESCDDCISRQAAQAKIKSICDEYRLSYEDGERKAATGGSAYALGHAFDDIPSVTPKPKIVPIAEIKFDDDMLHEIVEEAVKNIEIEPKTGHWIVHEIESTLRWLECSNCHCETSYNVMHNYCPNCGCAMKGELE